MASGNTEFSLIALIGVILLIGIVKKNAIMMIDFALDVPNGSQGLSSRGLDLSRPRLLRFRPIMMTTMRGAALARLPLALGQRRRRRAAAGRSASRSSGGLIVSQILTLYTTPSSTSIWTGSAPGVASGGNGCGRRLRRPPGAGGMTMRSLIPIVGVALALAGCEVGPDYHKPPAPVPVKFKEAEGWKPAEPKEAAAGTAWWQVYDDPLLDDLEKQIDVSNQTLKQSEAAYREAVAVVDEARAQLFPTLSLDASAQRSAVAAGRAAAASPAPRPAPPTVAPRPAVRWLAPRHRAA